MSELLRENAILTAIAEALLNLKRAGDRNNERALAELNTAFETWRVYLKSKKKR